MKEYKGYIGAAWVDTEAGVIRGRVVNTRDTITFQGHTDEEARRAFQVSVDDYLAFCAERGETPEKPFSGASGDGGRGVGVSCFGASPSSFLRSVPRSLLPVVESSFSGAFLAARDRAASFLKLLPANDALGLHASPLPLPSPRLNFVPSGHSPVWM